MDRVTLKHYQDRAAKAQALVDQIDNLLECISLAKRTKNIQLITQVSKDVLVQKNNIQGELPYDFRTHTLALMVNVYIDLALKEIQQLEQELAEL